MTLPGIGILQQSPSLLFKQRYRANLFKIFFIIEFIEFDG